MTKSTQSLKREQPAETRFPIKYVWWALGGVVGFALIVWMAWAIASEGDIDESVAFAPVTLEGEPLPTVDLSNGDPAVGLPAPTITGTDLDGNQVTIGPDGRPKVIILLAHWCPHCQREVPVVQSWIDSGGVPDGVDLYAATVLTNRLRDSSTWPPEQWLANAGWSVPTIMDDREGTIARSLGLTGTPYYVVLDGDNNNLGRLSGAIGIEGISALAGLAQQSIDG